MSFLPFSFDHLPHYGLIYALLFLMFLADIQVLPLFFDLNLTSVLTLTAIYYWSIYHPQLLPAWMLFTLGLLKDFLTGMPLVGLSAMIFIGSRMIVKRQRSYLSGQSFFMLWAGYILLSFLACGFVWLGVCAYTLRYVPYYDFLFELVLMAFMFPIILPFMALMHRVLPFAAIDKGSL